MKSTGIVRRIDELGRIVLPIELRKTHDMNVRDPLEIFVDGQLIVLRKYEPSCIFCGEAGSGTGIYKNKTICAACLEELKNL